MKKNIWIVVLFAATAVLAAVVVRQKQQIARMKEQSVSAATETPAARAPVKETPEPPTETKAVEPVAAPPTSSVPTSAVQAGTSTGTASNFFAGLAGMMKNPQMKEMIRAQQKMTLDKSYGALFKYLDRPPDQLDALKSLLVERQMAMIDAGLSAMSGSGSDSKQAAE